MGTSRRRTSVVFINKKNAANNTAWTWAATRGSCGDFDLGAVRRAPAAALTSTARARAKSGHVSAWAHLWIIPYLVAGTDNRRKREENRRKKAFSTLCADAASGGARKWKLHGRKSRFLAEANGCQCRRSPREVSAPNHCDWTGGSVPSQECYALESTSRPMLSPSSKD